MKVEDAKQELIRRYKYLYENACFILAPFMREQTKEEFEESKQVYDFKRPIIYLKIWTFDNINAVFEEFLLSDKKIEDTALYKMVESKRGDKEYLEQVKKGLLLLERKNEGTNYLLKESLDIYQILAKVYKFVFEQSGDLKNKQCKLTVIDEYYKIARYKNNGKIYTSGRNLNLHDVSSLSITLQEREPFRDKKDVGVTENDFITAIVNAPHYENNMSIFTEGEKQKIYLDYHDELPCDLEITCSLEDEYFKTMIETRLIRPENTSPCGKSFVINEEEIFVRPNDPLYKYFQLCPHCGYIVNIPKKILSEGVQQRIEDSCNKDDKLFRKMFIYSELFSLDKNSTNGQKKLLKK